MNVMGNGGAGAPVMNMGGGDTLQTLLLLQVLCPGLFGGAMGENPIMMMLLLNMMTGRGI